MNFEPPHGRNHGPSTPLEESCFQNAGNRAATMVLPHLLKRAVFKMPTTEPHVLAKEWVEMLKLYRLCAEQLQEQEKALHASQPPHVQQVVKGKRPRLLEERLNETGFPDTQVVEDFKYGVDLVGEEPFSHLYLEKLQPASLSVELLEMSAHLNRKVTISRAPTELEQDHADRFGRLVK